MPTKYIGYIALLLLMQLIPARGVAQTTVKGMVLDSITGEGLPFVSVLLKGTNQGTTTDADGYFALASPSRSTMLVFSYLGYNEKLITLKSRRENNLKVSMAPTSYALNEVVIKPGKERYVKKGNPAVAFVKQVIDAKEKNDPRNKDYYGYEKYEKMTFALNNFNEEKQKKGLYKKFDFLKDYVDTSDVTGQPILNVSVKESLENVYYRKDPKEEKRVVSGIKRSGIDELFSQEGVQQFLKEVLKDVDLFKNDIPLFLNRFVSPLSTMGPSFYKYYLMDTVQVNGEPCMDLGFVPFNSESFGFTGHLYITLDSTHFVKKVALQIPKDINLNFVEGMRIDQEYDRAPDGTRLISRDDISVSFKLTAKSDGLHARRTVTYKNHTFDKPADESVFNSPGEVIELAEAKFHDNEFWKQNRHIPIGQKEQTVDAMLARLREVPLFYYTEQVVKVLVSGYIPTAAKKSKVDIGPMNTSISGNAVEGLRFRAGATTTAYLNNRLFADGYMAYGTKDRKLKYSGGVEYSLIDKKEHPNEFPVHSIRAEYQYDVNQLGQHYLYTNMDNMFLSFKRKKDDRVTYLRKAELSYNREHYSGFSYGATLRHKTETATDYVPFLQKEGDGLTRAVNDYSMGEMEFRLRFAPGEKYYQTRNNRIPITFDAPIFTLSHIVARKGVLGADYDYNRTDLGFQKRFWFSAFGYTDVILKAGKIWDKVPFPLLMIPNANLSYTIQYESYALMNAMEFLNDRYASWDLTYFGNGVLFNRLPLIKELKWREVLTFRGLYGDLSDKNNPAKSDGLFLFPEGSYQMGKKPYMEVGVGVENILRFLRFDYVWRLTYRELPDVDTSGLRVSLHFTF